jgi:hypothetical protein
MQELAKPQVLGCLHIPLFFQVISGFQFLIHVLIFTTSWIYTQLDVLSLTINFK